MRKTIISLLFLLVPCSLLVSKQLEQPVTAKMLPAPVQTPTPTPPAPFGRFTEDLFGVKLELVRIPTGTFLMGNDLSPKPNEKPLHQVGVKTTFIGQYEITRQQWNLVATRLPRINRSMIIQYIGPGSVGNYYAENSGADETTWNEAVEFCERLSRYTGKKYRLPSEAEWEYACRAGTRTEYSFGDVFNPALANMGVIGGVLLPAGAKWYANTWGLYDMHGSVFEWCLDNYHPNYAGAPVNGSAWLQGGDDGKVMRGGSYGSDANHGRSSARVAFPPGYRATSWGLRVVAEISPLIGNGRVSAISAASYAPTPQLATESIVALFGTNLSGAPQSATSQPLPSTLAGASVTLKDSHGNEHLAPLFFASPNQINFVVPPYLPLGPATIYAVNNGDIHSTGNLEIVTVSPGLFSADASGRGLAAALALRIKSDGTQVYEPTVRFDPALNRFVTVPIDVSNPAEEVYLILFGTGFRQRNSLAGVQAQVGGMLSEVSFAGAQDDLIGIDQCNVRLLPSLAGRGESNVELMVDGKAANTVKLWIR